MRDGFRVPKYSGCDGYLKRCNKCAILERAVGSPYKAIGIPNPGTIAFHQVGRPDPKGISTFATDIKHALPNVGPEMRYIKRPLSLIAVMKAMR